MQCRVRVLLRPSRIKTMTSITKWFSPLREIGSKRLQENVVSDRNGMNADLTHGWNNSVIFCDS